ncbi:ATP dependent DNA ligase C terminal region [Nitrosospira briensis]|uniref:DNA ligase (ATP) n=1 Tax=Nitrosospira briensis TaxID=35799 RepID=A0A1I5E5E7_9PROT|nr:ATP dependent DNA ligase C terminal region [Nitrosospira briensis]
MMVSSLCIRTYSSRPSELDKIETADNLFARATDIPRNVQWVKPILVAEVSFSEWTRDGRIRHPSFRPEACPGQPGLVLAWACLCRWLGKTGRIDECIPPDRLHHSRPVGKRKYQWSDYEASRQSGVPAMKILGSGRKEGALDDDGVRPTHLSVSSNSLLPLKESARRSDLSSCCPMATVRSKPTNELRTSVPDSQSGITPSTSRWGGGNPWDLPRINML